MGYDKVRVEGFGKQRKDLGMEREVWYVLQVSGDGFGFESLPHRFDFEELDEVRRHVRKICRGGHEPFAARIVKYICQVEILEDIKLVQK